MTDIIQLITNLSQDWAGAKPSPHPYKRAVWWGVGFCVYIGVTAFCFGLRDDLVIKLHETLFAAELASLAALIFSAVLAALLLSYPDIYQKEAVVFAPLPLALIFGDIVLMEWLMAPGVPMPDHGMDCFLCIAGLALLPGILLFRHMRQLAVTHFYQAGGIAAGAAFGIGAFVFRLTEKTDSIAHLVLWHDAPMLVVAGAGVAAGRFLLKW